MMDSNEATSYVYDDASDEEDQLDVLDGGASSKNKAPREEVPEKMSKRKRKRLEQLREKQERRKQQSSLLDQLREQRLTADEKSNLRSSVGVVSESSRRESAKRRKLERKAAMVGHGGDEGLGLGSDGGEEAGEKGGATGTSSSFAAQPGKRGFLGGLSASNGDPAGASSSAPEELVEMKEADGAANKPSDSTEINFLSEERPAEEERKSSSFSAQPGKRGFLDIVQQPVIFDEESDDDTKSTPAKDHNPPTTVAGINTSLSSSWVKVKNSQQFMSPPKLHSPRGTQPPVVLRTAKIEEQRSKLPALGMEQEIVESVLENDTVLIAGDTGCGKSTQVPQFLYENGFAEYGQICVTQPRRVAAVSVCQRVGEELNDPTLVGYQVRYDRSRGHEAKKLKFATDGILLRELQSDFLLGKYSVIILDEAHERSVNCDILLGLLSRVAQMRREKFENGLKSGDVPANPGTWSALEMKKFRLSKILPPLKLLIMSATLRVCDFTENARLFPVPPPVVRIDARTYPVTVHFDKFTSQNYLQDAAKRVIEVHEKLPPGTILVFATGQREVHRIVNLVKRAEERRKRRKAKVSAGQAVVLTEEEEDEKQMLSDEEVESEDEENGAAFDDEVEIDVAGAEGADEVDEEDHGEGTMGASSEGGAEERLVRKNRESTKESESPVSGTVPSTTRTPSITSKTAADKIPTHHPSGRKMTKKERQRYGIDLLRKQLVMGLAGGAPLPSHIEAAINAPVDGDCPAEAVSGGVAPAKEDEELLDEDIFDLDKNAGEDHTSRSDPDTVMLFDGGVAQPGETEEQRHEKRVNMKKLDRSRTAGGLFSGGDEECSLTVRPLYAQLAAREQMRAFAFPKKNERIVIVATNVAETSVTLPNVRYVIDCGYEKKKSFTPSGVSSFSVHFVSKASADQRAGRAGRVGPGHCYRLFSSAAYNDHFAQFPPMAIKSTPLDSVLLSMADMGIENVEQFPWPTPPSPRAVELAVGRLVALGALSQSVDEATSSCFHVGASVAEKLMALQKSDVTSQERAAVRGSKLSITKLGKRLALLPMQPRFSAMVFQAVNRAVILGREDQNLVGAAHLLHAVCAIAAAMSIGNVLSWGNILKQAREDAADEGGTPISEEDEGRSSSSEGEDEKKEADHVEKEKMESSGPAKPDEKNTTAAAKEQSASGEKSAPPPWIYLEDDCEALLWALTMYGRIPDKNRDEFCTRSWLNPKQTEECFNLMQQLGRILSQKLSLKKKLAKVVFSDHVTASGEAGTNSCAKVLAPSTTIQPKTLEETTRALKMAKHNSPEGFAKTLRKLVQDCVVLGLLDHVAKQAPDRPKLYDVAISATPADRAAAQASSGSSMNFSKLRAAPHISCRFLNNAAITTPPLLVFHEMTSAVCEKTEEKRHFLWNCLPMDMESLVKLMVPASPSSGAASESSCCSPRLLQIDEVLAIPGPRYDRTTDRMLAKTIFKYLPLDLRLPAIDVDVNFLAVRKSEERRTNALLMSSSVGGGGGTPASDHSTGCAGIVVDATLPFRLFAKALLDGEVVVELAELRKHLRNTGEVAQLLVFSKMDSGVKLLQSPLCGMVQALVDAGCCSRAELLALSTAERKKIEDAYMGCLGGGGKAKARTVWNGIGALKRGMEGGGAGVLRGVGDQWGGAKKRRKCVE